MTTLVHGSEAAGTAEDAAAILFGGDPAEASAGVLATVAAEVPTTVVPASDLGDLVSVLVRTGLASSNGDARRTLGQHGVRVNGHTASIDTALTRADALHGRWFLLRKGKSAYHLVEIPAG